MDEGKFCDRESRDGKSQYCGRTKNLRFIHSRMGGGWVCSEHLAEMGPIKVCPRDSELHTLDALYCGKCQRAFSAPLIDEMFRKKGRDDRTRDVITEWLDDMVKRGLIDTHGLLVKHVMEGATKIADAVEADGKEVEV